MNRLAILGILIILTAGCGSKPPPPPAKDYNLEALHNRVRQMEIFIDNWSGYEQRYSRINNLEEYQATREKIFSSPAYDKFTGKAQFEQKVSQFDAAVSRYERWVKERARLLEEMEDFQQRYKDTQKQTFARYARPFRVGPYELIVASGYYELIPHDPDKAYASARFVGLNQLNIIAASKDRPLQLPQLELGNFVVEVKIINRSDQQILRPDGFIVHRQSKTLDNGAQISRSRHQHLVKFTDDMRNRYQFSQADGVINRDSDNGLRPGEQMIWSYRFNRENHPLQTVNTFDIIYPTQVFGKSLRLRIPLQVIARPVVPGSLQSPAS